MLFFFCFVVLGVGVGVVVVQEGDEIREKSEREERGKVIKGGRVEQK